MSFSVARMQFFAFKYAHNIPLSSYRLDRESFTISNDFNLHESSNCRNTFCRFKTFVWVTYDQTQCSSA